jgi:hypothetical protein
MPNTTQTNNKQQGCVTFTVNDNQSIHVQVNAQQNLPIPSKFICRNSADPNQIVYPTIDGRWRRSGGRGAQNINIYFDNTDKKYSTLNNYNSIIRWEFIQEEMHRLEIKQITVTVCPL